MTPLRVAIIGYGSIGQDLVSILSKDHSDAARIVGLLVRPGREAVIRADRALAKVDVTASLEALLAQSPDVVVECAGHAAVAQHGPTILAHGVDLIVASVGALAEEPLRARLETAAHEARAQCVVPSGAIGGIDALGAARLSGVRSVRYTGRKPPAAWRGTPAEAVCDLGALTEPFAFFTDTAREAAQQFPKNANVAATLALAGSGLDATEVTLIADPATSENVHEFAVQSNAMEFDMRLVGKPSPRNPKTSQSTVYSIARAVLNRQAGISI